MFRDRKGGVYNLSKKILDRGENVNKRLLERLDELTIRSMTSAEIKLSKFISQSEKNVKNGSLMKLK